ncbi:MAG: DUF542 domain-containing protein [Solirubrobacterales bacterium]
MHTPTPIDDAAAIGELAAENPARIRLFERLRLDYCCGGGSSLSDACRRRGLDLAVVRAGIEAIDDVGGASPGPAPERDWRQAGLAEFCEHVVAVHHGYLRRELPRISELLATVVRVHGADCLDFEILERAFASLRGVLEEHIEEEEEAVFPSCVALERGEAAELSGATIEKHREEHEAVGTKLAALRILAGDYELSQALCSTHGALLQALLGLEGDLHKHIHEENNVLLPRASELIATTLAPTVALESNARL